jgi:hypothetical protein
VPHVPTKKSVEQLCREFQGLQDLLFLLSPERRKRLKPMIDEVRRQIEDAERGEAQDHAHYVVPDR